MPKFPGIPEPNLDPATMLQSVLAMKQALETILGQRRGSRPASAVTWEDLVRLGIVEEAQIPRD